MPSFPRLENEFFFAFIAGNEALGIHRRGYNGVASLVPKHSGNNLFVPTYAGFNYETIHLTGLSPYVEKTGFKFEPRDQPMRVESADATRVVLVQPETGHAHVSARITFTVEKPHYLHQRIELTPHRRFCAEDDPCSLRSLWASYMHMPPDRHIYLQAGGEGLEGWYGLTKADHQAPSLLIRPLPGERELDAGQHLVEMEQKSPLELKDVQALNTRLETGLDSYYGLCGDLVFLMMFKQPERFRLAYSPCGGGQEPAWNPAWDYVLALENVEIGTTYTWDLCLAVKPYQGRADVLKEIRRYT